MKPTDGKFLSPKGWSKFFKGLIKLQGIRWRHKDYVELSSIMNFEKLTGTLLDVGCAFGDGLIYLMKSCPNVTEFYGCDVSPEAIRICKKNPRLRNTRAGFFVHDIMEPLTRFYDTIICLQTLEHVKNPNIVVDNLVDAANHFLVISAPFRDMRPDVRHIWKFDEFDFDHIFDYIQSDQDEKNLYWIKEKK